MQCLKIDPRQRSTSRALLADIRLGQALHTQRIEHQRQMDLRDNNPAAEQGRLAGEPVYIHKGDAPMNYFSKPHPSQPQQQAPAKIQGSWNPMDKKRKADLLDEEQLY